MTPPADTLKRPAILYSCYFNSSREGEQFVPEHVLSYQLAGTLSTHDGEQEQLFVPGTLRFIRRNRLLKFLKLPDGTGEYRNLSITLSQEALRAFSLEHGLQAPQPGVPGPTVQALNLSALHQSFLASLQPYEHLAETSSEELLQLKVREAILILLQTTPALKDVLFDFTEPGKLDLEAFMNRNFHFNVELRRFAYLTGRSLATFKRDFEKIFHLSPSRWLQQRRLQEAHYLIKDKGRAPSDVYLELGFEDLSHFSFAFKKRYGVAPSRL